MNYLDSILNRITMYRLVVYYLAALLVLAAVLGFFGVLPYAPAGILFSTGALLAACSLADLFLSRIFSTEPGRDSAIITALILALIMNPVLPTDVPGLAILVFISLWAIGSKYLIAWQKKQLFNPAALGVALSALLIGQSAT